MFFCRTACAPLIHLPGALAAPRLRLLAADGTRPLRSLSPDCVWDPRSTPLNCGGLHLCNVRVHLRFSIIYIIKVVVMYSLLGLIDSPWSVARGWKPAGALVRRDRFFFFFDKGSLSCWLPPSSLVPLHWHITAGGLYGELKFPLHPIMFLALEHYGTVT